MTEEEKKLFYKLFAKYNKERTSKPEVKAKRNKKDRERKLRKRLAK